MAEKIDLLEPSKRVVTVDLSLAELNNLVGHHNRMMGKIEKLASKDMLKAKSNRELKAILERARTLISAHGERGNALQKMMPR